MDSTFRAFWLAPVTRNILGYYSLFKMASRFATVAKDEIFSSKRSSCTDKSLVFSVTPFKIDQNKNQNRSIDKVQNLGNERRYIYKNPRQDSAQRNISYTRYPKKCFTQTYRDLYGDAMLVLTWMSSNTADGNQKKHLLPSFAAKTWIYSSRNS